MSEPSARRSPSSPPGRRPPRGGYRNAYGQTWRQPLLPLLKWRITRIWRKPKGSDALPPAVDHDPALLASNEPHLTWIGHATFALRLGGRVAVTDPVWSRRIYYMVRLQRPGAPLDALPGVDVVTVSHNHYDHLDVPTLKEVAERYDPVFLVPRGNGRILRRAGLGRVREMDWWETYESGDLSVALVPSHHWSARTPFSVNRMLWGGFVFEGPEGVVYHSGDTAYEPRMFRDIGDRFAIDWAMMPIGAYHPEWFLASHHMGPEDAARALDDLGARWLVPMHYGTFDITDEPRGEPLQRIRAEFERRNELERLWALAIGESRRLAREPVSGASTA